MDKLQQAIESTLAYAGFFHSPLTLEELRDSLISARVYSTENIANHLRHHRLKPELKRWLVKTPTRLRKRRLLVSQVKLQQARQVAKKLAWIPMIKLIAVTGSLAVGNATPNSDIDLLIVTRAHTLWLTRPWVILLVGLQFHRRIPGKDKEKDAICLNLWLDTRALAVPESRRNVYTAHEVLQVMPIFERGNTYQRFLRANTWVRQFMAGAFASKRVVGKSPLQHHHRAVLVPWWSALNALCFKFQLWYMKPRMTREWVDLHSAYFHPKDWAGEINQALKL